MHITNSQNTAKVNNKTETTKKYGVKFVLDIDAQQLLK